MYVCMFVCMCECFFVVALALLGLLDVGLGLLPGTSSKMADGGESCQLNWQIMQYREGVPRHIADDLIKMVWRLWAGRHICPAHAISPTPPRLIPALQSQNFWRFQQTRGQESGLLVPVPRDQADGSHYGRRLGSPRRRPHLNSCHGAGRLANYVFVNPGHDPRSLGIDVAELVAGFARELKARHDEEIDFGFPFAQAGIYDAAMRRQLLPLHRPRKTVLREQLDVKIFPLHLHLHGFVWLAHAGAENARNLASIAQLLDSSVGDLDVI